MEVIQLSRIEFAAIMAYLTTGCGKPMSEQAGEVYFDLLGDLPADALRIAAKQALLEQSYSVLPQIGTLRKLATDAIRSASQLPSSGEAWGEVRRAITSYGYMREAEGLASLSPLVRKAAECLGWQAMCDSTNPEALRAHFGKTYDALAAREQRQALLPAPVREEIKRIGQASGELVKPFDNRNAWQVLKDAGKDPNILKLTNGIGGTDAS